MSILVKPNTKVLIQGITGSFGAKHAQLSIDYGSQVVAGVTPGKGGQCFEHGGRKVPIFDTVAEAVKQTGATASAVFVPPPFAGDAILEGAEAGLELVVAITEGIPVRDMIRVKRALADGGVGRLPRGFKFLIRQQLAGLVEPSNLRDRRRFDHGRRRGNPFYLRPTAGPLAVRRAGRRQSNLQRQILRQLFGDRIPAF